MVWCVENDKIASKQLYTNIDSNLHVHVAYFFDELDNKQESGIEISKRRLY